MSTTPAATRSRPRGGAAPPPPWCHAPSLARLLMVAKTQRWKPEEFLRTLVEAEIASRDASNARARMAAAAFPVTKTLDEFDVDASSVPEPPSTTWPASSGSPPRRISVWSDRPGPASPISSSPSDTMPSTPASGFATSPPPTSSRPSIAAWPTTPWAG